MAEPGAYEPVAILPTYDNPLTVGATVEKVLAEGLPVILVDDGSADEGRAACAALAQDGQVFVVRRPLNGGKGIAVRDGLRRAEDLGFTHGFQIDSDGQHDITAVARFLEASRAQPEALVLGAPQYDESAPQSRMFARKFMLFWVRLETGGRQQVGDAMIGLSGGGHPGRAFAL